MSVARQHHADILENLGNRRMRLVHGHLDRAHPGKDKPIKAGSAPIVSYLPLDSYYPSNHLVVVIAPRTAEQERLCREQVPAHGLHFLWVVPEELGPDPRAASALGDAPLLDLTWLIFIVLGGLVVLGRFTVIARYFSFLNRFAL